tara:strand:+ start:39 stop:218 length:180 start_codon:yes stop_codon:yes gene_type:complete
MIPLTLWHCGVCGLQKITNPSTYRNMPMRIVNRLTYGLIAFSLAYFGGHVIYAILNNKF